MHKIRELRKAQGLSLKRLGEILGVAESTMSLYENGKRQPDYETLKKIATHFNVSTDYLLGKDEPTTVHEQLSGEQFALYGEVKDLTDEEARKVMEFIKFTKSQRGN